MLYNIHIHTNDPVDHPSFIFYANDDLEAIKEYFAYHKTRKEMGDLPYTYTIDLVCHETNFVLTSNTYKYDTYQLTWYKVV